MTTSAPPQVRTFPVMEVFGPTVQGEGALAGLPTYFVRFGGCDYRCSWCDSMFAVEPAEVRDHAERLTESGIRERIASLPQGPAWITLSGGNPALLKLDRLVRGFRQDNYLVSVETQGSRWRDWLSEVACLTVSPKPPSSGMVTDQHEAQNLAFMEIATTYEMHKRGAVKIVVFDEDDLTWARRFIERWPDWPAYLSVGTNPVGQWGTEVISRVNDRQVRDEVGARYKWLCERVAGDPSLARVRVLPQLHVVAWGHKRAV